MSSLNETSGKPPHLTVAICTYRRPQRLQELLNELTVIDGRDRVVVLVVDNDPDRSAEKVTHDVNTQLNANILYTHVTPQGLATARNAALDFGGERSMGVLFIDDDEKPEPAWLTSMLSSHASFPSAIITGPVRPKFAGPLPNWAPDGFFWLRSEHQDGESLRVPVGTGNTLFPAKVTVGGFRFDTAFDLIGGEDTHFMLRWLNAGEEIVGSANAIAVENVPVERLSLKYARDRAYFSSLAYQHAIQSIEGRRPMFSALRLARRWTIGALFWIFGVVTSSAPMEARSQISTAAARGIWAGMRGRGVNRWVDYQVDA